jgi:hypothetical protein
MIDDIPLPKVVLEPSQIRAFYAEYLKEFNVAPFKPEDRSKVSAYYKKHNEDYLVGVLANSVDNMMRLGKDYILSIGKRIFWKHYPLAEIVNQYFLNKDILGDLNFYAYVIITFDGKVKNSLMPEILNTIIQSRRSRSFYTLVISTVNHNTLGIKLDDVLGLGPMSADRKRGPLVASKRVVSIESSEMPRFTRDELADFEV